MTTSFLTTLTVDQKVDPQQLSTEVWDHILLDKALEVAPTSITPDVLHRLKQECQYFYPCDLRVSGKDLIANHLAFYIYNHVTIFPEHMWPKGIRVNGHLLINNEKMSKSTGNFLTLSEAINQYSADATRLTLAEAGDGIDDANFDIERANSLIVRLHALIEWVRSHAEEKVNAEPAQELSLFDRIFEEEMKELIHLADRSYDRFVWPQN